MKAETLAPFPCPNIIAKLWADRSQRSTNPNQIRPITIKSLPLIRVSSCKGHAVPVLACRVRPSAIVRRYSKRGQKSDPLPPDFAPSSGRNQRLQSNTASPWSASRTFYCDAACYNSPAILRTRDGLASAGPFFRAQVVFPNSAI